VLAVFYALVQGMPSIMVDSTDILFILVSGGVSLYAFLVINEMRRSTTKYPNLEERVGKAYYGIFLAIFLWFLGETTWGIYEVILRVPIPYPSIADIFYLAGYIPALVSTAAFMWIFRRMTTSTRKVAVSLLGLAIIGAVSAFLLQPLATSPSTILKKTLDFAYPFLDAVLLALVSMIMIGLSGVTLAKPWRWIFAGFLVYSIADIMFSWGTLTGWYYSGHPIELLWLYGYLAIAIGFNQQKTGLQRIRQSAPR
jgi:hypothetical protein